MSRAILRPLALALLTACGGSPALPPAPPVPLEGSALDIGRLEGSWVGEFLDSGGGRHGVITLTVEPGRDTAHGQMLVQGSPPPAPLRLGRIVVAEGSVAGWIESYRDAELDCPVDTWFEGRLQRDTLRGMFFAHPELGDSVRRGTWWAARQASR
jgi:hypothetical protein